jgi:hypothetical protein
VGEDIRQAVIDQGGEEGVGLLLWAED